jgi:tRNA-binding EMAP/Myf-like protein
VAHGQDIAVDVKKVQKNYGTKFSKDFKISFTNANAVTKEKVILKATGVTVPAILQESADLTKLEIKFTSSSGKLFTKDKDGKDVTIPNTGFEILVGDKLSFNVVTSNNLVIDIIKPDKEYQTDYSKSFKISFTGEMPPSEKYALNIMAILLSI